MGRALLCTGKYARNPYYFHKVCVNVYSIEEMCFLFAGNPFMIDNDIMDRELVQWIDSECGLPELAHQLLLLFNRGSQPGLFVNTILDYVNYCTPGQRKKIDEILQSSAGLNDYEKKKRQADFLLSHRKLQMAIDEYDRLCRELPETESALKPSIYHNMGVAYAELFLFDMAARYFKRSYDMTREETVGVEFLLAKRFTLSEEAYVSFIAEHGEYHELSLQAERRLMEEKGQFEASLEKRRMSALSIYKDEGNVASYYEEIDKLIATMKDDYRGMVEV